VTRHDEMDAKAMSATMTRHIPTMRVFEQLYFKLDLVLPLVAEMSGLWRITCLRQGEEIILEQENHGPYTSLVHITHTLEGVQPALSALSVTVRVYHDMEMVEVVCYQEQGRIRERNPYPNPRMHQPREKQRINEFVSEWLDHCLKRKIRVGDEAELIPV